MPTRSFDLAAFMRPMENDVAATASVGRAHGIPDRLPVMVTNVRVGVSYEPLRRLWPLLGPRYELALPVEHAWPERPGDDEDDHENPILEVSTAADAERAVEVVEA